MLKNAQKSYTCCISNFLLAALNITISKSIVHKAHNIFALHNVMPSYEMLVVGFDMRKVFHHNVRVCCTSIILYILLKRDQLDIR